MFSPEIAFWAPSLLSIKIVQQWSSGKLGKHVSYLPGAEKELKMSLSSLLVRIYKEKTNSSKQPRPGKTKFISLNLNFYLEKDSTGEHILKQNSEHL